MTTIVAEVIKDSISKPFSGKPGRRITTMQLRYPRIIHAEVLTHRILSRNSSSSRAIPAQKIIDQLLYDPFVPIKWLKAHKGMQGYEELSSEAASEAESVWLGARDHCVDAAHRLLDLGVTKQLVNRILEPWSHISVVVTATEWTNFFSLRWHGAAEVHFQALAEEMRKAFVASTPKEVRAGDWHLPYVSDEEVAEADIRDAIKYSSARCCRVSYLLHDGATTTPTQDLGTHNKLISDDLLHASPFEHPCMALEDPDQRSGNVRGWLQYRKTFINENIQTFPWEVRK